MEQFFVGNIYEEPNLDVDPAFLSGCVCPVVALNRATNGLRPVGTCFLVHAEGIALTALHVLEEALQIAAFDRDGDSYTFRSQDGPWSVGILTGIGGRTDGLITDDVVGPLFPIARVTFNRALDMAALGLDLPRDDAGAPPRLAILPLHFGAPQQGDVCVGLGYHSMDTRCDEGARDVARRFRVASGTVEEVHIPQRDPVLLPFPCFRVGARYLKGMSGGPILSVANGGVVGMITSSADLEPGVLEFSYGSLIASAMCLQVPDPPGNPHRLIGQVPGLALKPNEAGLGASFELTDRGSVQIRWDD